MRYQVIVAGFSHKRKKKLFVDCPSSRDAVDQVEKTLNDDHYVFDVSRCDSHVEETVTSRF